MQKSNLTVCLSRKEMRNEHLMRRVRKLEVDFDLIIKIWTNKQYREYTNNLREDFYQEKTGISRLERENMSTAWIGPRNVDQIEMDIISRPTKFKKNYKTKGKLNAERRAEEVKSLLKGFKI